MAEQNADAIHVSQDINPGELVDDRSILVAVTSRRKLGKQLTIARCVVDDVRGELSGGLARNEIIDVVAGGASAGPLPRGRRSGPRHRRSGRDRSETRAGAAAASRGSCATTAPSRRLS